MPQGTEEEDPQGGPAGGIRDGMGCCERPGFAVNQLWNKVFPLFVPGKATEPTGKFGLFSKHPQLPSNRNIIRLL
jgi:hypothetical protein